MIMSREVITAVSRWAMLAFGLLFIISMFFGRSFVEKLLAWIFLWFFIFHFHYGSREGLTSRAVKQIDYYYLGIAAIGIFLLGFSSSSQRETFTNQHFSIMQRQHVTSLIEGSRLFEDSACGTSVPALATPCDVSSQIKRLLTGSYSASDLRAARYGPTLDGSGQLVTGKQDLRK
jgi:hypothetical protein